MNLITQSSPFLQLFVVIGTEMDKEKVDAALTKCLLTDNEMSLGPKGWEKMEDPFKESWEGSEAHGHDHDHSNGHHHHH